MGTPRATHGPSGLALTCRRLAALAACAVLLATATAAHAVPTVTTNPSGSVVAHLPVFTVTGTTPASTINWTLTGPDGYFEENNTPNQPSPVTTPQPPLGIDGPYVFTATVTETPATPPISVMFTLDTTGRPAPMILSGPPDITGPFGQFIFGWTGAIPATSSFWQLLDLGIVVAEGTTPGTQVSLTPPQLAAGDRILRFRVRLLDAGGSPRSPFSEPYVFNVDQTPPGAPTGLTGPTGTSSDLAPVFSWQGTEIGGTFEWDVIDSSGAGILGPGASRTTTATSVTPPSLPLAPNLVHQLLFRVQQIDPYGNRGPVATYQFALTTVPVLTPAPKTRLAQLMLPKAGSELTSLRPLLQWRKTVKGATFYNVQVYAGTKKVLSIFPASNKARVPKGKLKPGKRYIWYVWEYIGKKKQYAPRPLTSWFEIAG